MYSQPIFFVSVKTIERGFEKQFFERTFSGTTMLTILAGLVMYTYLPKKPTLHFESDERQILLQLQLTAA
jgi:hypothetical protein